MRFEDLDRVTSSREIAARQLEDLLAIGLDWDDEPVFQSERFPLYEQAIEDLVGRGLTYECFCSRREIQDAARAPHGADGVYPGTCRELSSVERAERRAHRPPALRLNALAAGVDPYLGFVDRLAGSQEHRVDDVVLRRNDGVPSYNVAVVVDDAIQGVTQVVRGDDLLSITSTQIALQKLWGFETPEYAHVPLMRGDDGERLAKRHGAVTLADLAAQGTSVGDIRDRLRAEVKAWGLDGQS